MQLIKKYDKKIIRGTTIYTPHKYPNILIAISGVGKIQAAMTSMLLISQFKVERIINYGYAGYYGTDLLVGDIINIDKIFDCDMDLTVAGNKVGQYYNYQNTSFIADANYFKRRFKTKNLSSSDKFLDVSSPLIVKLIDDFGSNVADMEGIGIAVVCQKCGIPFSILKCISNTLTKNTEYQEYYNFAEDGIANCAKIIYEKIFS